MDFAAVIHKIEQLLVQDAVRETRDNGVTSPAELRGEIYGRVCTKMGDAPPTMLSSDAERKSVFMFGPDAVKSLIDKQSAYDILCSIGRDKDYLHYTVCMYIYVCVSLVN